MPTVKVDTAPTAFFSLLFWILGMLFIMWLSDASWWVALLGVIIGSIEVKVRNV